MKQLAVYGKTSEEEPSELIELSSVSLCFRTAYEMRRFGEFVTQMAKEFEEEELWDHVHFNDVCGQRECADIILAKLTLPS